jgi:YD repeat-containing protein
VDPIGITTSHADDSYCNLTSTTQATAPVGSAAAGSPTWGSSNWHAVDWGQSTAIVYAAYGYSGDGNLLTISDANSNLTTNVYDGFNRLIQVRFPSVTRVGVSDLTDVESYSYDANSNRLSLTKRDGQNVICFAYDALNRMTAKTFDTPTSCATASSWTSLNVAYAYYLAGRPTSALYPDQSGAPGVTWAYDAAGRRIGETTNSRALAFTYDSDDNPATMTWPDGVQMTYGFDAADRFASVGAGGASVSAGYDSRSRMTSVVRGGVSTTVGYDNADRAKARAVRALVPDRPPMGGDELPV